MTDQTVWARGLTDQQLANGLRNTTEFVTSNVASQLQAILNEAARRIEATADKGASVKFWTYSQVNPGGADVTHGLTFTGTDTAWSEHLADMTYQGIEVYNAKITAPPAALGSEPATASVKLPGELTEDEVVEVLDATGEAWRTESANTGNWDGPFTSPAALADWHNAALRRTSDANDLDAAVEAAATLSPQALVDAANEAVTLNAADTRHQVLVTLPNGAQVFIGTTDPNPQVKYRTSQGGSWSATHYPSKRPHEKNTIYVGEW